MKDKKFYADLLAQGDGVLNLTPTWVPRPFNKPGRRIRLHPDDTYAMGMKRGAIVERWFSSITKVETEGAEEFEGMSFVNTDNNPAHKELFKKSGADRQIRHMADVFQILRLQRAAVPPCAS